MGCISSLPNFRSHCDQNFYIFRPNYQESTCTNNMVKRDIVFKAEFCGIRLGNLDWMEKRTLQVYGYNDGLYNVNNRYAYIKLSSSSVSTPNTIWKDVYIRQIRVLIISCHLNVFQSNRTMVYNSLCTCSYPQKFSIFYECLITFR